MTGRLHRPRRYLVFSLVSTLLLVACSTSPAYSPGNPSTVYPVAPLFQDFYNALGGEDVMGPAISPVMRENGVEVQYLRNAKMLFDRQAPEGRQYRLASLGLNFGVEEPPIPPPDDPSLFYTKGHVIYPEFFPLFAQLWGAPGKPLTEARSNGEEIIQYFANMGMGRVINDPYGEVYLLPYGLWECARVRCYETVKNAIPLMPLPPSRPELPSQLQALKPLTGELLAPPQELPNGKLEYVFSNIVLVFSPNQPEAVQARNTVELMQSYIGIPTATLVPKLENPYLVFRPQFNNLGLLVFEPFDTFIRRHGGYKISGEPLSPMQVFPNDGILQCFTNICLRYHPNLPEGFRVQPTPIGQTYLKYKDTLLPDNATEKAPVKDIQIFNSAFNATLAQGDVLVIDAQILSGKRPLMNERLDLLIHQLNQVAEQQLEFPLTDAMGRTRLILSLQETNITQVVPYEVCYHSPQGKETCAQNTVMIWITP